MSINSSTGEIDLAASTIQSYKIFYETSGAGCPNSSTFDLAVTASGISNVYSISFYSASSDYINVASDPLKDGATNFSYSVWVKVEGIVGSSNMAILENWQTPAWLLFRYATSNLHLYFGSTTRIINETLSSLGLDNNNWNHIVVVNEYDNSAIKIYVNGALQYTKTSTQIAYQSNTNPLQIGGNFNYWNGQIDEVGIWNTALTSTQVQSIYDATGTNLTKDLTTVSGSNLVYWNRMGD